MTKPQGGLEHVDQQRLLIVRYDGSSHHWKFNVYPLLRTDFKRVEGVLFEKADVLLKTFLLKQIPQSPML